MGVVWGGEVDEGVLCFDGSMYVMNEMFVDDWIYGVVYEVEFEYGGD